LKNLVTLFLVCLSSVVILAQPASDAGAGGEAAEKSASKEKKPTLSQVIVVTATRSERELSQVPVSTTVITEDEVEEAPAFAADDLLRTVPGVQLPVATSNNTFIGAAEFSIRGVGGNRALVMVDGIPVHEPYYGSIVWQKIPLDTIRQVEVVRGGSASLFGNFALGGTVNMLTKPVERSEVRFEGSYGSAATDREALTIDQVISDTWGVRASHHRYHTDGVYRILDPGPADRKAWADFDISTARAEYHPSDRATAFFKAAWNDIGISAGTVESFSNSRALDLAAGFHRAVGSSSLVSARVFREDETFRVANAAVIANRTISFLASYSDIPVDDTGASLEWSSQRNGAVSFVSAGIDFRDTGTTENRASYARSGAVTQRDVVEGHQQFVGAFAQASWHPVDRLEILASARLDNFRNDRGRDMIVGGETTTFPSKTSTEINPRIAFRYELSGSSALRGSLYRAFQAPTLRDLYRNAQTPSSYYHANPNLDPETSVGGDLGVEWVGARSRVSLTGYWNEVDNLLTRIILNTSPVETTTRNVGKSRSQGIEATADVDLTRGWSLDASYTLADATVRENADDPAIVGKQIPLVPKHVGALGLRYRGSDGLAIDFRYRMLSTAYGDAENLSATPSHNVLDVSVSRPVRSWLDLFVKGENVLDERYYYIVNTTYRPAPVRSITGGLRIVVPTGSGGSR